MNKLKKSQILILSLLAALLFIAPLLSPSLRPTYLYFVVNFLIIALGAEAGLLSLVCSPQADSRLNSAAIATINWESSTDSPQNKATPMGKSTLEKKDMDVSFQLDTVKKCPSMPNLFFIEGNEGEAETVAGEEEEEIEGVSGQELFDKAENFIGNFYKQLKMQREESWNRIHGFY